MENLELFSDGLQQYNMCIVCLSTNRNTFLIPNKSIFLRLMGEDITAEYQKEIIICWECLAQIHKFLKFQQKYRKAQIILKLSAEKSISSLSTLVLSDLHTTTVTQSHSTEDSPTTIVRADLHTTTAVKEEDNICDDDFYIEDYDEELPLKLEDQELPENTDINLELEEKNDIKIIKTRKNRYAHKADTTKNLSIDWNNFTSHYSKSVLSEEEITSNGFFFTGKRKGKRKYCKLCNKSFNTNIDTNRHKTYAHILNEECNEPLQCLECKKECCDTTSLRAHWTSHNTVMRCNFCHKAFTPYLAILKQHLQAHALIYTCNHCDVFLRKSYTSSWEFSAHFKSLHLNFFCDYCGKKWKSKASLLKHVRSLHVKPSCPVCKRAFKRPQFLRSHIDSAHPGHRRPVQPELSYCVECDKQFGSDVLYKKHLATTKVHNPSISRRSKTVPCPECERVFTRTTYMNNHYKQVHSQQSAHRCMLCDKILFSAWSLKQHIAGVHMKFRAPKDKICDYCGYAFSTNAELAKHRRTHTGERPYRCPRCPAAFTQCTPLKSHLRTQHKLS